MNTEFNRDLMVSMLRRGSTGTELMDILNVIVPDNDVDALVEASDTVEVPIVEDAVEDVVVMDPEFATL
jgi:hypothetical protein